MQSLDLSSGPDLPRKTKQKAKETVRNPVAYDYYTCGMKEIPKWYGIGLDAVVNLLKTERYGVWSPSAVQVGLVPSTRDPATN